MKVLYLTEDYLYSKVHNNLLCRILDNNPDLTIYVVSPVRHDNPHGLEDSFLHHQRLVEITPKIDIPIWQYKFFWNKKIKCKIRLIEKNIPVNEIDVIHAATLYSDGATALRLHRKYDIPYIASIRGGDVMFYARKMPHLWLTGIKIINNADTLLCVTPAIKNNILHRWQHILVRDVLKKSVIINNGIDDIWLNNIQVERKQIGNKYRILYIGRFDKNKNVMRLLEAIKKVRGGIKSL